MASCYVLKRTIQEADKTRERYHVRFEAGRAGVQLDDGSIKRILHLGVFDTKALAAARRKWALEEWAAGRVPDPARIARSIEGQSVEDACAAWVKSRVDIAAQTRRAYVQKASEVASDYGSTPAAAVTPERVRAWVAELGERGLTPGTIGQYMNVLRQVLDYADVDPNPARHRLVKLPKMTGGGRMRIPSTAELAAIRAELRLDEDRVLLDFIAQTGVRISGAFAVTWRDVDYDRRRVLIRETKTRSGTRWVGHDPPIAPLDLPVRPAFAHDSDRVFDRAGKAFPHAMRDACRRLKIRGYSPHDLRHRHASICLAEGMDPARIAARLGHANPGLTLSVYSHVILPE